jgi:DNA mismatch repair protein MutS2
MSLGAGPAPPVLETLEFPAALDRVAAHAVCPLGAARVRARRPGTDADVIRAALAQVAELAARMLSDDAVRAAAVPDIAATLELLAVPGSALEGPQLVGVHQALAAARLVGAELGRLAAAAPRTALLRAAAVPKEIETRLGASFDPEGELLDAASRGLAKARRAVREARQRLVARLETILNALDPLERSGDAAVTVRGGRYVIPIRTTARAKIGGIVHDESATRATVFVEPPEVIELGNELRSCEAEQQRETLRVLRELTELLRPQRDAIAAVWEMCIAFDDLCARARYAVTVNGFAPAIGDGPLVIRQGRHPLLETGDTVVVPFDLSLVADEWTVLISGPNTGGKTVLVKAVGLICLLAQSGVIPPLGPESRLPIFAQVFADIGDHQSIAANLSTFSAHAAALKDILETAGPGSLVLLDEIGGGTDPTEGAALAGAALRALTRRRVVTLATTHLGALKRLAAETVGIVNASLQFDAETLRPTYRLLKGMPGRSYGLAIARRLGIAADVLAEAERDVPDVERSLDALLAKLEERDRELAVRERDVTTLAAELAARTAELEALAAALREREQKLRSEERTLDVAARERARAYLLEARKTVEAALAQARATVTESTAREARRIVEQAIEQTGEEGTEKREGWVNLEDLRQRRVAQAAPQPRTTHPAPLTETASSEVSLRGLRVDEAEAALVQALDAAVVADLPYLRVIHGKGTGALRDIVQAVLERDSRVARFGLAAANQGGSGVTVVEFRG